MIQRLNENVLDSREVHLLYLLTYVRYVRGQNGAALLAPRLLLRRVVPPSLLDISVDFMIVPRELIIPLAFLETQHLITALKFRNYKISQTDGPGVCDTVFGAHPLEDHTNDVEEVLMYQVKELSQPPCGSGCSKRRIVPRCLEDKS